MLARKTTLTLPDGNPLDLPILIPSFSSKGFGFHKCTRKNKSHLRSYATADLHEFSRSPKSSVLVSAYDLHFDHFAGAKGMSGSPLDWLQQVPLIFLDSGGYELTAEFDSSEPKSPDYEPRKGFGISQYKRILKAVNVDPGLRSFAVANFDQKTKGKPLSDQIKSARGVFQIVPECLHSFIIKPWEKGGLVEPGSLSKNEIKRMSGFQIIGITEKDIGLNHLDRLKRIAQLRVALDDANMNHIPIHIWGGLDPAMTPLYFFAGAQIFDGISWLRYAYMNGVAVNRECFQIFSEDHGIKTNWEVCRQIISMKNIYILDKLSGSLREWVDGGGKDFSMFDKSISDRLSLAYKTMLTEIPEIKEAQNGR